MTVSIVCLKTAALPRSVLFFTFPTLLNVSTDLRLFVPAGEVV